MRKTSFLPDLRSIWKFLTDSRTDWKPKVLVILALAYLLWPLDLLPDVAPVLGWLDDLGFVGVAAWYLVHATREYLKP
jgi:uncharacterized membrane protein YkvA (DUF1232 family)